MTMRRHQACLTRASLSVAFIAFMTAAIAGSNPAKAIPTIIDFNAGQGFVVRSIPAGDPASPPSSYVFGASAGSVMFGNLATGVRFFFVDNAGGGAFTATAFDALDNVIGTVSSNQITVVNDPANFVSFDPNAAVRRIAFTGGIIDNFAFEVPEPGTLSILATGMLSLLALRRRRRSQST